MKALETSVGFRCHLDIGGRLPRAQESARGKKTPSELSQNVGYGTNLNRLRYLRIHIPCYGDLPLRIISHVAGQ